MNGAPDCCGGDEESNRRSFDSSLALRVTTLRMTLRLKRVEMDGGTRV